MTILSSVHLKALPTAPINLIGLLYDDAVSQSYPNYLGGLNEQPDELKKPGQLSEALNVIPDPVYGLVRRPGFQKLADIAADPRTEPGLSTTQITK